MTIGITCVTADARDPAAVAEFWNEALGWGGVAVHAREDGAGAICGPPGGGIYLEFVKVPEEKVIKNRMHLGCTAGSLAELETELERLMALGATVAWEEEFEPAVAENYRNLVLRDIEGNEFCLGGGQSS